MMIENVLLTKTPFLGGNSLAGLETEGQIFGKKIVHDAIAGVLLAHKNNMGNLNPLISCFLPHDSTHPPTHFQSAFGCQQRDLL
jgi:hypothetical protein